MGMEPRSVTEASLQTNNNRVAVIGASGYGGLQSLRLLQEHPYFEVTYLGGYRTVGSNWNQLCPFLPLDNDLTINNTDPQKIAENADYVILSLPNGNACKLVPELLSRGLKVIDLSADFRYNSLDQWKQVYSEEAISVDRKDDQLCRDAIYGLPEWKYDEIANANLIASPGCFPTASLLPLLPFLHQGLIEFEGLIIDAKTGTSGGGRDPKEKFLLSEASESITPYGVIGHRHTSEIEQLASQAAGSSIQIQFTPHLLPMVRGLHSTVYAKLRDPGLTAEDCTTVLTAIYRNKPMIRVLPVGTYPATKWARHTNMAYISVQVDTRTSCLILMCSIDNLIKGQAGQAIQSLNIMAGLNQIEGLPLTNFYP